MRRARDRLRDLIASEERRHAQRGDVAGTNPVLEVPYRMLRRAQDPVLSCNWFDRGPDYSTSPRPSSRNYGTTTSSRTSARPRHLLGRSRS